MPGNEPRASNRSVVAEQWMAWVHRCSYDHELRPAVGSLSFQPIPDLDSDGCERRDADGEAQAGNRQFHRLAVDAGAVRVDRRAVQRLAAERPAGGTSRRRFAASHESMTANSPLSLVAHGCSSRAECAYRAKGRPWDSPYFSVPLAVRRILPVVATHGFLR